MAAERKRLKAEIDRTLKKVQEGQELFDDLWNQVHESENSNQRDKLEGELKKEIKKLQRLREQIKAWIAGPDVKDKQPLLDARKSIEKDMERFKVCEKEAKTKGYSGADKDKDPKQRARDEAREWINSCVDQLQEKVELLEAEGEELQANLKKKQKPPSRLTEVESLISNYNDHTKQLEKLLRCIDNETIQPDQLDELKSELDNFLKEGEMGGLGAPSVDDFYVVFQDQLEAVDQAAPAASNLHSKLSKSKDKDAEDLKERDRERERAVAAAAKLQLIQQGNTNLRIDEEDNRKLSKAAAAPPSSVAVSGGPGAGSNGAGLNGASSGSLVPGAAPLNTSSSGLPPSFPSRFSAASTPTKSDSDAGNVFSTGGKVPSSPGGAATAVLRGNSGDFPRLSTGPAVASQSLASAGSFAGKPASDAAAETGLDSAGPAPLQLFVADGPISVDPPSSDPAAGLVKDLDFLNLGGDGSSPIAPAAAASSTDGSQGGGAAGDSAAAAAAAGTIGGSTGKAAAPPPSELQLPPVAPACGIQAAKTILEACYARSMPQASDLEWRHYRPRHPVPTPASFPKSPPDVFENPLLFSRMDPEALFFAFYFQPGTYQQYLAAQELKRQSWRFHKQHNAWFQRSENPAKTNDEYELGSYVYFDYNLVHDDSKAGWCYRRKENFTFRYDALEDELPVAKGP